MFSRFGAPEIILIVVVLLLLFGGKKIPELMKGLGSGIKEFKDATKDSKDNNATTSSTKENDTDSKSDK